jgi:hypothetical protein
VLVEARPNLDEGRATVLSDATYDLCRQPTPPPPRESIGEPGVLDDLDANLARDERIVVARLYLNAMPAERRRNVCRPAKRPGHEHEERGNAIASHEPGCYVTSIAASTQMYGT